MFGTNIRIAEKNVGLYTFPEICLQPPNILHEYQCKIEMFGFIHIQNTKIIRFEKIDRIRMRILFSLKISIEYEYYLV